MERLFERHPGGVPPRRARSLDRCTFSLDELRYQYPCETEPGETAQEKLERLTWEGARTRYPGRHSRRGRRRPAGTSCT